MKREKRNDVLKLGLYLLGFTILCMIIALVLSGCVPNPSFTEEQVSSQITRWHDNELNVTCWKYASSMYSAGGLSCIPDHMLENLPPEADTIRTVRPTDLYDCTQIGCEATRLKPNTLVILIERNSCTWLWVEAEGETGYVRADDVEGNVPEFDGCPPKEIPQEEALGKLIGNSFHQSLDK